MQLILGSSSPYRKKLLDRLGIEFQVANPDIDETAKPNESAQALVERLALEKATVIAKQYKDALIIGGDQVAVIDQQILGKPRNHAHAVEQLQLSSGKTVKFLSALCLLNSKTGQHQLSVVPFSISFKILTDLQIENYLRKDKPYNCAGSIRAESMGVALFEKMQGDDPTALMGLPLIRLTEMLKQEGVDVLS